VVDLGCAPGGWTQIAVERIDPEKSGGQVVGLDLLPMDPVAGATNFVCDFTDDDAPDRLKALLGGPVDIVLSDMAANTTGHPATDHLRIVALLELAYAFACEVLAPGGAFVAKVFQGGAEARLRQRPPCQASGEPQGFGRNLHRGHRLPPSRRRVARFLHGLRLPSAPQTCILRHRKFGRRRR
jgi:SAM-dependent methyltransferase